MSRVSTNYPIKIKKYQEKNTTKGRKKAIIHEKSQAIN